MSLSIVAAKDIAQAFELLSAGLKKPRKIAWQKNRKR